jgi:ADP-ribose pyrophosphatase YjhB (NUDIX family)
MERRDPDAGGLMPKRIDYYDDPNAPAANSMVPSVNVVIENDASEILMIERSDNGNWALPGGAIDLGESMSQAGVRETKEETGIDCEILDVIGIYTDPKHIILYTSNGEARQEFSILLRARAVGGQPTTSSESTKVRWIPKTEVSNLQMDRSMQRRIAHYLSPGATLYFD